MTPSEATPARRIPVPFSGLPGWCEREAKALLSGLSRHLAPEIRSRPHEAPWLASLVGRLSDVADPRAFVEAHFQPQRIAADGFLTAYYEPVIAASRQREGPYQTPLYRRPDDLVRVAPDPNLPGDGTFAQRRADGRLGPYPDRVAIGAGALAGKGLELAFVADPVDAFFAQIQGSARLSLTDGSQIRVSYHGKTGHPYTAIGRVLIDRGVLPEGGATMATIRAALAADPALVEPVLNANRSFVFFRERPAAGNAFGPIAAAGLPLIPWRSLAVDRAHIALGSPVFVETVVPRRGAVNAVMIAEDTGSAILGPARGDIFMGSGEEAGALAGDMKAPARLTLILPKAVR
ncbi:MAG: MltA domain-containing protein [Pseudomonadota bacterium]